jgi:drug/metabolite transporter (DMT)-like permease
MGTYFRLILTMFFWGGTFIAARLLGETMHPLLAACGRFVLASLFLLAILRYRKEKLPRLNIRQWLGMTLAGLTGIFSYNIFFFAGLQHVEAGRSAMIIAGNPVVTTLLAILFLGERFSPLKIVGIFLTISGALTVILKGNFSQLMVGGMGVGEMYLLCCVLSWSAYTLVGRKLLTHISPLVAVTYSCLIGTVFLLCAAVMSGVPFDENLLQKITY